MISNTHFNLSIMCYFTEIPNIFESKQLYMDRMNENGMHQ